MSEDATNRLDEQLRRYAAWRADEISQHEANLVMDRALSRAGQRRGWTRHGVNAAAAVALSLILIAGGVLLEAQLRGFHGNPPRSASGSFPAIPNEIVNLDDPSTGLSLEIPFDLKTGKVLAPVERWVLPQNRALVVYSTSDCSSSTIRVVDRATEQDTQPEVTLADCFDTPIVLPGTSVLLSRHRFVNGNQNQFQDGGEVMYDWSAGRITKSYPALSISFVGGLASPDGSLVYTLNPFAASPALDITDLASGSRVAHVPVIVMAAGFNPGGLGLSPDGRTLFVNLGDQLATFDARTGSVGPVVPYTTDVKPGSTSVLPAWLTSIDADAKEGFEPNHGIAIDPKGRWVVALGAGDLAVDGMWILSTSSPMHVVHHIRVSSGFSGVAFSLDGSVLYALDGSTYVDLFDPQTGQLIRQYNTRGNFLGIAGVQAR